MCVQCMNRGRLGTIIFAEHSNKADFIELQYHVPNKHKIPDKTFTSPVKMCCFCVLWTPQVLYNVRSSYVGTKVDNIVYRGLGVYQGVVDG